MLFSTFFDKLESLRLRYAVTGRTERYPEHIHSDIDIVLPPTDFARWSAFLSGLRPDEISWIQEIAHEATASYCVIARRSTSDFEFLKPDACSDYYRDGTLLLRADYLLENRVFNPKGFHQLAPDREFIYYLLKKLHKGALDADQFAHLHSQWLADRAGCRLALEPFFSSSDLDTIVGAFDSGKADVVTTALPSLRARLLRSRPLAASDLVHRAANRIRRVLQPTGLVVAIMGPDGCGKSTVLNTVVSDLSVAFRRTRRFHFLSEETEGSRTVTTPHGQPPRGAIAGALKSGYYWWRCTCSYFLRVLPLKTRSTCIFFDRYLHDALVDPHRYRFSKAGPLLRLAAWLAPKPDLWILLAADAEVIHRRKAEVPVEETRRQLDAYRHLFSKLKNAHIVDAGNPPERVIFDVEAVILKYLEERNTRRQRSRVTLGGQTTGRV